MTFYLKSLPERFFLF